MEKEFEYSEEGKQYIKEGNEVAATVVKMRHRKHSGTVSYNPETGISESSSNDCVSCKVKPLHKAKDLMAGYTVITMNETKNNETGVDMGKFTKEDEEIFFSQAEKAKAYKELKEFDKLHGVNANSKVYKMQKTKDAEVHRA